MRERAFSGILCSMSQTAESARLRRRIRFRGRVQGVGFRPWIYRLAVEEGLAGHVGNDTLGAFVELEGGAAAIEAFLSRTETEAPALVEIAAREEEPLEPEGERSFKILSSRDEGEKRAEITPDAAPCDDCLREMRDSTDRRHRYPFINCTNCGPRYSIVKELPYDRERTTMAGFVMCEDCAGEYGDPADRRFHAQPDACPVCGPRVWLCDREGREIPGDALEESVAILRGGGILAIKGLGGYHLACRADLEDTVVELRRRKQREAKPLALMVGDLDQARELAELDPPAARLMESVARPIVLVPAISGNGVAESVAHGSHTLGLMLPSTPLHQLLFETGESPGPLVMTSGNPSAEPLCAENDEALQRLGGIADAFLMHDRPIERRVDDSVSMALRVPGVDDAEVPRTQPLRRARGYAPAPITLSRSFDRRVLALGGELKSTICLLRDDEALLSEHLGDLDNPAAYRNFAGTIESFQQLYDFRADRVACDLHPAYASTRFAEGLGLPMERIQHHHAHVAAAMVDNGLEGEVLGLACDGTGYGDDGRIWGCELLLADEWGYRRVGQLRNFALLGGDAAARETWRPAAGLLAATFGEDWPEALPGLEDRIGKEALEISRKFLAAPVSPTVETSSLGRLFDAAAFLLGLCDFNHAEAQAPMALEAAAARHGGEAGALAFELEAGEILQLDWRPLVADLVSRQREGRPVEETAAAFHRALAEMLASAAGRHAAAGAPDRVVLSGGCFANRILVEETAKLLKNQGLEPYLHHRVPAGDGAVALGQAVIAAARAE